MGDLTSLDFTSNSVVEALETTTVLTGTRSVTLGPGSASSWSSTWTRPSAEGLGYTAGKIFAKVRVGSQTQLEVGFFCMSDSRNFSAGSGSAIMFGLGNYNNEVLWNTATGLAGMALTTPPIVTSVAAGLPAVNTTYWAAFEWLYDADIFEGLYIIYRRGTSLATMTQRLTYFFAPADILITAPSYEGMYAYARSNGTVTNSFAIVDDFTVTRYGIASYIWERFEKFRPGSSTAKVHLIPEGAGVLNDLYSVEITGGETGNPGAVWMSKAVVPVPTTSGRVRMRLNVASGPDGRAGIILNPSQRDMMSGGTCYTLGPNYSGGATTRQVQLRKCTSSILTGSSVVSTGTMPALNTAYWIEVRWQTTGGTVRFDVYTDTTTDFSAPALLFTSTDSSSPYLTSAGLGWFAISDSGTFTTRYDQITLDNFGGF